MMYRGDFMKYVRILDNSGEDIKELFAVFVGMDYINGKQVYRVRRLSAPEQTEFDKLGLKNARLTTFTAKSGDVVWVKREKAKKQIPGVYYVALYKAYPIYEPAEGGYYYEGLELVGSNQFLSKQDARRALRDYASRNGFNVSKDGLSAYKNSRLIGESEEIYVERRVGSHEKGRIPYS